MQRNGRESSCLGLRSRHRATLALLLCGALSASLGMGCSKKERPASVAANPGGLPPLANRQAGTPRETAHPMPADHPQFLQPRALPAEDPTKAAAAPAAAPAAPAAPGASNVEGAVRGSLVLDAKLKDKAKPGAVIFLSARGAQGGAPAGPPLAVKRLTVGAWPQPFELSAADAMMPGLTLRGQVVLSARIDQDEDAMTKQPGDIEGSLVVTVPANTVELRLDKVRTEAAGGPSPPGLGAGMGGGTGDNPHGAMGTNPHAGMGANPHGNMADVHPPSPH